MQLVKFKIKRIGKLGHNRGELSNQVLVAGVLFGNLQPDGLGGLLDQRGQGLPHLLNSRRVVNGEGRPNILLHPLQLRRAAAVTGSVCTGESGDILAQGDDTILLGVQQVIGALRQLEKLIHPMRAAADPDQVAHLEGVDILVQVREVHRCQLQRGDNQLTAGQVLLGLGQQVLREGYVVPIDRLGDDAPQGHRVVVLNIIQAIVDAGNVHPLAAHLVLCSIRDDDGGHVRVGGCSGEV